MAFKVDYTKLEAYTILRNVYSMLRQPYQGNALGEYGLVGSLVVLVCIAGFITAGGNLNDLLASLGGDMTAHRDVAVAASQQRATTAEQAVALNDLAQNGAIPAELLKELTNQERAALSATLAIKLQTLGANGTTKLLSKQLVALARQLLAEGKISQPQSDIIMRMANQGYRMAEIESVIEDAARMANGDMDKLKSLTFQFQGEAANAYDLASKLGFNAKIPKDYANVNILDDYGNAQFEMASFLNFYQQAQDSGLMTDPDVRATIESAATQIANTGESVESILYTALVKGKGTIPSYEDFKNKVASNATSMNSSRICTAGKFKNDGVSCQQ